MYDICTLRRLKDVLWFARYIWANTKSIISCTQLMVDKGLGGWSGGLMRIHCTYVKPITQSFILSPSHLRRFRVYAESKALVPRSCHARTSRSWTERIHNKPRMREPLQWLCRCGMNNAWAKVCLYVNCVSVCTHTRTHVHTHAHTHTQNNTYMDTVHLFLCFMHCIK
jgi:hypothetical protein